MRNHRNILNNKTGTNIRFGWKISIQGDLDANALITTPVFQKDSKVQFARWRVINGTLQSQSPEFVIMSSSLLTSKLGLNGRM